MSLRPSDPLLNTLTKSTPSESNSLNANLNFSVLLVVFWNASAMSNITSSALLRLPVLSLSLMPMVFNASRASPVPLAASAMRLVILCNAMSVVSAPMPACSAAYLNFCRNSAVTPSFSLVSSRLAINAVCLSVILVIAAAAPTPSAVNAAVALTNMPLKLVNALPNPTTPLLAAPRPAIKFLVFRVSVAAIGKAIILTS